MATVLGFAEAWRKVFSLRTLGGGYVRYFLLFSDSGLLLLETDNVRHLPPWNIGSTGDILTNMVNVWVEELKNALKKDDVAELFLAGRSLEEAVTLLEENKGRLGVKKFGKTRLLKPMDVEGIELGRNGVLKIVAHEGGKQTYEIHPDQITVVDIFLRRIFPHQYRSLK
ncbi:MAG: hypothetical protein QXE96_04740 [Candidatus Caldarchaeum sp.]|jgi:hypothetical protein